MKKCTKCKVVKSYIDFSKSKSTKDSLRFECKLCNKQYRLANVDKIRQYMKQWGKDNAKSKNKYLKQWKKDNPEYMNQWRIDNVKHIRQYTNQYYFANIEYIIQYKKQWKIDNPNYNKQYHIKNKDKINQYNKQWMIDNPDYFNQWHQSEHGKLIKKSIAHKRRVNLKTNTPIGKHWKPDDIILKLKLQNAKCVYCQISIKKYYQIDHIIPVSKGGNNEPSNIQLLCKKCNGMSGKGTKDAIEYAQQHGKLF